MKPPLTSLSLAYCKIKPSKLKDTTLKCRNISPFNYLLYIESAHRAYNNSLLNKIMVDNTNAW